MIPVEALWPVVFLAAVALVLIVVIEQRRIHEIQDQSDRLKAQLQADEEQLDDILGRRQAPAHDDYRRAS